MTEYLKPFENKCCACQKSECINTKLFKAVSRQSLEERGVGRVRFDQGEMAIEHKLPIQDCPTRKTIEKTRKGVRYELAWELIKDATIREALCKLDNPISTGSIQRPQ